MIAKLTGKLDSRFDTSVVIDVNGVGYALFCSQNSLKDLPSEGSLCTVLVEPLIRQEAITLFGFSTDTERSLFRLLLTVQGVGGKVCLSILSVMTSLEVQHSILGQDHIPFTRADGVGPKVAQRIVRELKDKVAGVTGKIVLNSVPSMGASSLYQESVSALVNLGYKKQEALEVVHSIIDKSQDSLSLNQVIPLALKKLAGT